MKRKVLWAVPVAAAALTAGAVAVAQPPSRPSLTGVPTANTRSEGYAPASKLSRGAVADRRRPGLDEAGEPDRADAYYGYDNDVVNSAGQPQMVPLSTAPTRRGAQDRAGQEHLPGLQARPRRRRPELRLRHPLPVPGPRERRRRRRLHHPDQPRRRRRAPGDAAGDHRRRRQPLATIDGSTWDPWAKRLLFTTENASAPTYAATPGLPVDGHRRLRRARARRLRGHPERLRRQHLDRRGHRRLEEAGHRRPRSRTASSTATCPSTRATSRTASCRCCRCCNAAGDPITVGEPDGAQQPRPARAAHLRQHRSTPAG